MTISKFAQTSSSQQQCYKQSNERFYVYTLINTHRHFHSFFFNPQVIIAIKIHGTTQKESRPILIVSIRLINVISRANKLKIRNSFG